MVHVCSTQSGARVSKTGFQVDGGVFAALKVDQAPAEDKKMLGIAAHHAMGTLPTIQRELFEHATSLADLSSERPDRAIPATYRRAPFSARCRRVR